MPPQRKRLQLTPARTLDELYGTISPEPLVTPDEINAFYRNELNALRREDQVERLKRRLDHVGDGFFHGFLVGQNGSGKSTEISRFLNRIEDRYLSLRIFVSRELNPSTFQPFDVLLLLIFKLAKAVDDLNSDLPERKIELPEPLLHDLLRFFGTEARTTESFENRELEAEAKAKLGTGGLWARFLEFSLGASGKIRVGYREETKLVQYRFQMLSHLAELANRFLDACNAQLQAIDGREWFVVMEEFDKPTMDSAALREVFVERGSVFDQLSINLLITVPVWLFYSSDGQRLPFGGNGVFVLTDTPVYNKDHTPNVDGRNAVRAILEARVDRSLLEERALELLIVASGGNIRDLFGLVMEAGDSAALSGHPIIREQDARRAIYKERDKYRGRLGNTPDNAEVIDYPVLLDKLRAVYDLNPLSKVPDLALNRLLRSRAVLHFNGDYWYGVHPLVVDILKEQNALPPDAPGGVE